MFPLYILLLLASLLIGMILFATGVILLFKVKNKIAGILVMAVGLVFSLCPLAIFLFEVPIIRIQG